MISDIIQILDDDTQLTTLLGAAHRIVPDYVDGAEYPYIVYEFYPTSNDGIKVRYRLTLRIIAATLAALDNIENRVDDLLLTFGDKQLNDSTISVAQNGGGNLKDPDTGNQHRILYLDVLKKATHHA